MNPLSSFYYIKENKLRSGILIILFMCTVLLFVAGNYISSMQYYWDKIEEYDSKICLINAMTKDEDFKDFGSFIAELKNDNKLIVLMRTSRGYSGLDWMTTMGIEMGSSSMVFNSVGDLKTAFDHLGIDCDLSNAGNRSVIMSKALAAQYGLKEGDVIDEKTCENIRGSYKVAALTDDNSYMLFYVINDNDTLLRAYVMSDEMSGNDLREYLKEKAGSRMVWVEQMMSEMIDEQLKPFDYIFLAIIVLLSVIHAITVGTVLTGHFIKRTYEFGIYRALGMSKGRIFRKCASEMLVMDLCGIAAGILISLVFTFMMNELYYIPKGQYLPYFSKLGLSAFAISDLCVLIPNVISRSKAMSKADVTEF